MMIQIFLAVIVLLSSNGCDQKIDSATLENSPAIVEGVLVTGVEGNYNFSVTLKSPDTGCNQYANWWEVISADGTTLVYRRILGHSHVNEQPFTRSGGPVAISAATEVIVRAHMHPSGYGKGIIAMKGSVDTGFSSLEIKEAFAAKLEMVDPQPSGCAF